GRRYGNRDECQNEHLLTPFTARQPPRPSYDRSACGDAAIAVRPRGPVEGDDVAHGADGPKVECRNSSSGLGGGSVSSTALPSPRNTTRSAHEAQGGSWDP